MSNISRFLIVIDKKNNEFIAKISSDFKKALERQNVFYFTDYTGGNEPCPGFVIRARQVESGVLALDVEDASLDSAQTLEVFLSQQYKTQSLKVVAQGKDKRGETFATDEVDEYVDLIELEL